MDTTAGPWRTFTEILNRGGYGNILQCSGWQGRQLDTAPKDHIRVIVAHNVELGTCHCDDLPAVETRYHELHDDFARGFDPKVQKKNG